MPGVSLISSENLISQTHSRGSPSLPTLLGKMISASCVRRGYGEVLDLEERSEVAEILHLRDLSEELLDEDGVEDAFADELELVDLEDVLDLDHLHGGAGHGVEADEGHELEVVDEGEQAFHRDLLSRAYRHDVDEHVQQTAPDPVEADRGEEDEERQREHQGDEAHDRRVVLLLHALGERGLRSPAS